MLLGVKYALRQLNRFIDKIIRGARGAEPIMANIFSSICEMNLVTPPQPCSGRRTHRVEFQFSDNSRLQVFVCERHAANVACVEKALLQSGEFPAGADMVAVATQELRAVTFTPTLAVAAAE